MDSILADTESQDENKNFFCKESTPLGYGFEFAPHRGAKVLPKIDSF